MSENTRNSVNYRSPIWLQGPHLQTIFPFLFLSPTAIDYDRQTVNTPDGDFLHIDWVNSDTTSPLVVVLHGLEGSSNSHYAKAMMHYVRALGWSGCVIHFRGCSGVPNRLPRAYHSGDSDELEWLIAFLGNLNFEKYL